MQPGQIADDIDSQATRTLRSLVERLSSMGYAEFFSSFDPLRPRPHEWAVARDCAPVKLRPLLDLFLLTRSVCREALTPLIGDLLGPLCELRLCSSAGSGQFVTPGLVLLPVLNNWLFCQPPQAEQTLYFGDDSVALLWRMRVPRGSRCLDLCAGPGIQSLQASHLAAHVDAVEINPVAVALARVNVIMNGAEDRVSVHCGDLYEPVRGARFDVVIANPPLLPFPDEIPYPLIGNGGPDGMRVTWRILDGLQNALLPKGRGQLIGCCFSDGILPLCLPRLETWAAREGVDALVTITAHQPVLPGTTYFEFLVDSAAKSTGLGQREVGSAYAQLLKASGATHLCAYFLLINRGEGKVHIQDMSDDFSRELWYVSRSA